MRSLTFKRSDWDDLVRLCEQAYPKEACGILLGREAGKIEKIVSLENLLAGGNPDRLQKLLELGAILLEEEKVRQGGGSAFAVDPEQAERALSSAWKEGLDQIGVFHSHPDKTALPSSADACQYLLVGWSNVILSVRHGRVEDGRSWIRETETGAFHEEKIIVE